MASSAWRRWSLAAGFNGGGRLSRRCAPTRMSAAAAEHMFGQPIQLLVAAGVPAMPPGSRIQAPALPPSRLRIPGKSLWSSTYEGGKKPIIGSCRWLMPTGAGEASRALKAVTLTAWAAADRHCRVI